MNTTNAAMTAPPKTTARMLTPMATDLDRPCLPLDDPAFALPGPAEEDDVTGCSTGRDGVTEPVADADDPVPVTVFVALPEETRTLVGVVLTVLELLKRALELLEDDVGVVELDVCSDTDDELALDVEGDIGLALVMSV